MTQYLVDAFTSTPFSGNPAAVCVMDAWPSERSMMLLARENNLSETAFVVREGDGYRLRWFTPTVEVEICGHATLASALVVLDHIEPGADEVRFETMSGELVVRRRDGRFEMDFPAYDLREVEVTRDFERAFGARPVRAVCGLDLVCVFEDERVVREMRPDQELLRALPGRIQNATARGYEVDCVSRSFCPKLGIPEDPVCGSAHTQIAAFWADVLGKDEVECVQASTRGGRLRCGLAGEGRVTVSGEAVLVGITEIVARL